MNLQQRNQMFRERRSGCVTRAWKSGLDRVTSGYSLQGAGCRGAV